MRRLRFLSNTYVADEFGDYLVLMGAVMREEMVIEWLTKCLELLG